MNIQKTEVMDYLHKVIEVERQIGRDSEDGEVQFECAFNALKLREAIHIIDAVMV